MIAVTLMKSSHYVTLQAYVLAHSTRSSILLGYTLLLKLYYNCRFYRYSTIHTSRQRRMLLRAVVFCSYTMLSLILPSISLPLSFVHLFYSNKNNNVITILKRDLKLNVSICCHLKIELNN